MASDLLTNPVKLRFYLERYEKENRLVSLQETFVPTARTKALTGKFYAKHDVLSPTDVRQDDVDLIKRRTEMTPKDVHSYPPPAVNMEYGWFITPLIPVTKDPRLRFARKYSDFIVNEVMRRKQRGGLPEKKFTGVPFKV